MIRCWRATRSLASLDVQIDAQPTPAAIWWALRSSRAAIRPEGVRQFEEPFTITLEIASPTQRLTPALVKSILDGVVCGLQSQNGPLDAALASRIADRLDTPPEKAQQALADAAPSTLGVCPRLVCARGSGVQWLPDDHLCTAAKLTFKPAKRWHITGTVAAAAPARL